MSISPVNKLTTSATLGIDPIGTPPATLESRGVRFLRFSTKAGLLLFVELSASTVAL